MPGPHDDSEDDLPRRRRAGDSSGPRAGGAGWDQNEDDYRDGPRPKKGNAGLLIGVLVGGFVLCCGGAGVGVYFLFVGAQRAVQQAAVQARTAMAGVAEAEESRGNLTQIGNAVQKHHDTVGTFPTNSYETRGKQSRPLLSWRVHLLPQLGEEPLYKEFKLNERWDSPANRPLVARMPGVYGTPEAQKRAGAGKTFYRGFTSPNGMFEKPRAPGAPVPQLRRADVTDGTSNTILVIDAGEAVEWTRPDDLDFSVGQKRPALGGAYPNYEFVMVLMADGTPKEIRRDLPDQTLRLLIDRQDGQLLPAGWAEP